MTVTTIEMAALPTEGGDVLDKVARKALRGQLKEARSAGGPVLLTGPAGSWAHRCPSEPTTAARVGRDLHALVLDLYAHPAPVMCYADGPVSGLGLALLLACDLRVAGPDAMFEVGAPAAVTALLTGSHRLLSRQLGRGRADELTWGGRVLPSQEAVTTGLVLRSDRDDAPARELVDRLRRMSPASGSALKRSVTGRDVPELKEQLAYDAWLAVVATGGAS